jgi:hypothetical protein
MSPYQMPPAFIGQMVNYFHQAGGTQLAAVVLDTGSYTLKLGVFIPEVHGVTFFDGVRHASDPNETAKKSSGMGEWDYCPTGQIENALRSDIAALRARVAEEVADMRAYFESALKAYQQAHGQAETKIQALEAKIADLLHKKKAA